MKFGKVLFLGFAIGLTALAPAWGQATRTWVSGVGDDANPCSRTAPCKTFAGAISKTAAGGEINTLDPGGFGAVTITKSISIISDFNGSAGVLASGTNGIIINAGANDVVVIRGLDIEGATTGLNGIRFLAGKTLIVENCTINGFRSGTASGISIESSLGTNEVFIKDTVIRNNGTGSTGGGILIKPTGGSIRTVLDHVRLENNIVGIRAQDNTVTTITNSSAVGNSTHGFQATNTAGGQVLMTIDHSISASNVGSGVDSSGNLVTIRISGMTIVGNANGLATSAGGAIQSFGDNNLAGNNTNGTPTTTVPKV